MQYSTYSCSLSALSCQFLHYSTAGVPGSPFALIRVLVLPLVALKPLVECLGCVANVAGCSATTHNLVNLRLLENFRWIRQWRINDEAQRIQNLLEHVPQG